MSTIDSTAHVSSRNVGHMLKPGGRSRKTFPRRKTDMLAALVFASMCIPVTAASANCAPVVVRSSTSVAAAPQGATTSIFSITSYGAVADGVTNDRDALASAIDAAGRAGGGTVQIPDRKVLVQGGWIEIPSSVTIAGAGPSAQLLFTAKSENDWRLLFRVVGDNVTIRNLKLTRMSEFSGVMIDLRSSKSFSMDGVVLDGRSDSFRGEFHGILIYGDSPALISGATVRNSTLRRLTFGLLQPSERTIAVDGFKVDGCAFELNLATDLEFNAPASRMTNVVVSNSTFRNNKSTSSGAGWGIGMANVQGARVTGNRFQSYGMNPIHIEDRSAEIVVANNSFSQTSTINTGYAADVIVLSGARSINITGNSFDSSTKPAGSSAVYIGSGGSTMQPNGVVVTNNSAILASGVTFLAQYNAANVTSYANSKG